MTHDTPYPTESGEGEYPTARAVRAYPVARGNRIDYRFTDALLRDVADVLADHGYPVIDPVSGDYEELGWTLWRFIFGGPTR